jgi:hypothetical protein
LIFPVFLPDSAQNRAGQPRFDEEILAAAIPQWFLQRRASGDSKGFAHLTFPACVRPRPELSLRSLHAATAAAAKEKL